MLSVIHNTLLVNPIFNIMALTFKLTGSLGFSIIILTIIVKVISTPFMLPSLRSVKKQQELQPQLEKIKTKYKYDKKKQAELQMQLMKEHGVNPASGCYSMIITILIFTALYSVINQITKVTDLNLINQKLYFDWFKFGAIEQLSTRFFYLDLAKPDPYFILAILAGLFQFIQGKMSMPYTQQGIEASKKTPDKKDDIAYNMQQQTMFIMPAMMALLGISMPSGVIIYIITTSIISIIQSYFINGWGGMRPLINKLGKIINVRKNN
ncbi:hypothetical protein A2V49_00455 [candidate division WWE3 bacterium RBG_19FT_COMBO_34_6]|uniref:Membrane insertase YidC/Oxa/ALB C-terminal domain-containing protein n=1 Tax=candidate division WWE3 bacterium RBG_19FT_COMBO_34_6 TaxID=1802612 RepID=A0A1F4UNG8_UNCKA|nr:MAG: hypothetical protein A2V49_00455 [candidate division WWE3 bacterium RBG_19FT_COMBO_34_6]